MSDVISGYQEINDMWGQDPKTMRKPTGPEAIKACRLLIKEGFRAFGDGPKDHRVRQRRTFKLTSGRRSTYPRSGVWYVNPNERNRGLAEIVHSVSHVIHNRVHPHHAGHSFHVSIERHLVEYCLKMRWIEDGFKMKVRAPKAKPTPVDRKVIRLDSARKRLKAWQTKAKRAQTAIKKLAQQIKRTEKALAA